MHRAQTPDEKRLAKQQIGSYCWKIKDCCFTGLEDFGKLFFLTKTLLGVPCASDHHNSWNKKCFSSPEADDVEKLSLGFVVQKGSVWRLEKRCSFVGVA